MDENGIFMTDLMLELTDSLQKRLAFDITDGSAHLNNSNLSIGGGIVAVEAALDLIGDMRDDLNGTSAKITAAFFLEYAPVYLTGGDIGVFGRLSSMKRS